MTLTAADDPKFRAMTDRFETALLGRDQEFSWTSHSPIMHHEEIEFHIDKELLQISKFY